MSELQVSHTVFWLFMPPESTNARRFCHCHVVSHVITCPAQSEGYKMCPYLHLQKPIRTTIWKPHLHETNWYGNCGREVFYNKWPLLGPTVGFYRRLYVCSLLTCDLNKVSFFSLVPFSIFVHCQKLIYTPIHLPTYLPIYLSVSDHSSEIQILLSV